MGQEKEAQVQGGRLTFEVRGDGICIKSCKVTLSRVIIPQKIQEVPVTAIDRKAFLSCKSLKEIWLPEGLEEIGDWAFAYCDNLESIYLPGRRSFAEDLADKWPSDGTYSGGKPLQERLCDGEPSGGKPSDGAGSRRTPSTGLSIGKGVFKECRNLALICPLDPDGQPSRRVGALLGAAVMKLEAAYLFSPTEAGEKQWLMRFDDRLREFLNTPDEDGFVKMVYCGEEDIVANVEFYLAERRREKARLCFLRLINDDGLSGAFRQELSAYLAAHTKGCESEAAWEVVFKEHGNERSYYEAFVEAGCLTAENYDGILLQMGDRFPEMKAWLMRNRAGQGQEEDFFEGLSLD